MPVVYETVVSNGKEHSTEKIVGVYKNYYGPTPYTNYDSFSMNSCKEQLDFFVDKMNCEIENPEDIRDGYCFTINYKKENNLVVISQPGEFFHKEICFTFDFKKIIEKEKKDFYNLNSEKYILESIDFDMTKFYSFLERELSTFKNPDILDLGFGSGRDMLYLKRKGFNVEGVDSCLNFVSNGLSLGLSVSQQILPKLDLNKKFDIIYSVGVIFHLNKEERLELFSNIKNHLNNNGILVLSYNTLDRTNDKEREFFLVSEDEINQEVGLTLLNQEIMKDGKRDFNWITSSFIL